MESDFRIGYGFDVHALGEGLRLVLGGVEIPHTKGCIAHSDGDAAIHAVCDALLGAAALGDIGQHFPDTSDEYAGIDSKVLLQRVAALLRAKKYEIGNVDCTISLQRPRLRPHIDAGCDGRRYECGRRSGVGQSHDHRAPGFRRPRRGRLGGSRGTYLQERSLKRDRRAGTRGGITESRRHRSAPRRRDTACAEAGATTGPHPPRHQ